MGYSLVIGTGLSGISAVNLLCSVGEEVLLFDANENLDIEKIREKLADNAKSTRIILKEVPADLEEKIERLVLSPGVPIDSPMVNHYRDKGVEISGEIELAYKYEKGDLLAITGTNGKTTTTSLLGAIMKDYKTKAFMYKEKAFVVGNIGTPYTGSVLDTSEDSVTVAEISSFQLETVKDFHAKVSAILNITPDHLNRHHTLEQYIVEKEKIAINQTKKDYVILNYSDPVLRQFAQETTATPIFFSSEEKLDKGFYLVGDLICMKNPFQLNPIEEKLISASELNIIGKHNLENAMAAIAMAYVYDVPMENIIKTCQEFKAVAHRIEFVAEKNGVVFYNDSKGTNVDAAIKGIQAMTRKTCLIGGGYDKGADFTEWIESFDGKVKKLVLIGQTREKIAECCEKCGFKDYVLADTFEEALDICVKNVEKGDAVLLSPACASWGMFGNYEQRGDIFKELVKKL